MSINFDDSLEVFLKKAIRINLVLYAENVEEFVLKKFRAQGFSEKEIYSMRMKRLWPLVKDIKSKRNRKHFQKFKNNFTLSDTIDNLGGNYATIFDFINTQNIVTKFFP
jgi:hypothetical protein